MMPLSRLAAALSRPPNGALLVDIGASSLTGVRADAAPKLRRSPLLAHPIYATLSLSPEDARALGSDCLRTGLLFEPPAPDADDQLVDAFGVTWLSHDGGLAPLQHPLEHADLAAVARHPRPVWRQTAQLAPDARADQRLVIADAPCPGLLDTCFLLRNGWQFMEDLAANWRVANALLDWSLETVVAAYEHLLSTLPRQPDILVYGDDLGYGGGMYLSPLDFHTFIHPRLRTLLARLRQLTPAAICLHSCGAIRPILPDLAALGVELLNLDPNARHMAVAELRRALPNEVVLHGTHDLCALGAAVRQRDWAAIALLSTELAVCTPLIAAPPDSLSSAEDVTNASCGAAFIHALSDDDLDALRRIGPVRSILKIATEAALSNDHPLSSLSSKETA